MATTRLQRAPQFSTVRSTVGAAAADPATIDMTNYPLTLAFEPYGRAPAIICFWGCSGGTVLDTDFIDIQPLYYDGSALVPAWREGALRSGIRAGRLIEIPTFEASCLMLRIVSVSCAAGTALYVRAANGSSDNRA